VAHKVPDEYLLAGLRDFAADDPGPGASCPACGASLAAAPGVLPRSMAEALLLTNRERAVFRLLGFGYDNRSIARELQISERTVKRYVTGILAKLALESRLQAGLVALTISSSSAADAYWPKSRMDLAAAPGDTIDERKFQCPGGSYGL
jgi:DNA-binding CsgD family transcriptional regulator